MKRCSKKIRHEKPKQKNYRRQKEGLMTDHVVDRLMGGDTAIQLSVGHQAGQAE